ncbi:holo-ACP synthase [Paludifilum halophilum]|uniref:Holo-[acyl-carrier-protein] synthase n=1 Tax=Paludifilum halophilum TaxID=1642702 RepID=A0A235B599_9BACL|nr:holo-ACP synthase [Paludifilum halophilum]OYD06785.1 holo-[acyl-carrier-protein] synthase [Paludifilum halophilum]
MILGIGTDLIELSRVKRFGVERLADRILSEAEKEWGGVETRRLEWIAGRFTAKEAVAKAAGTGIGGVMGFRDIRVLTDDRGQPFARLSEKSSHTLGWKGDVAVHLSITHTDTMAAAFVVIEQC